MTLDRDPDAGRRARRHDLRGRDGHRRRRTRRTPCTFGAGRELRRDLQGARRTPAARASTRTCSTTAPTRASTTSRRRRRPARPRSTSTRPATPAASALSRTSIWGRWHERGDERSDDASRRLQRSRGSASDSRSRRRRPWQPACSCPRRPSRPIAAATDDRQRSGIVCTTDAAGGTHPTST